MKIVEHQWHFSKLERQALMVVLHGRGDSPAGFAWLPEELNIPELSYLMLQAPDPYFDGFSWYDLPPNQLPGILRSRKLLAEVFEAIEKEGFKPEQCFLFGFSQGCLMTLEFGSRFPHRLKGYIGISGYCYDVETLLKEAIPENIHEGNWLITHGTQDDVLPIEKTREQMKELMARGFKMEYLEYKKSHALDPRHELPKIREWVQARLK